MGSPTSFYNQSGVVYDVTNPPGPAPTGTVFVSAYTPVSHQFVTGMNSLGEFSSAQPAFSDISGVISPSQIPAAALFSLGGVDAITAVAHEWVQYIDTSGVQHLAQPAFSDLSGTVTASQLPGSFSGFANPSNSVGLSVSNGSAATAMRSDATPALSQAIVPTWTGDHTFQSSNTIGVNGSFWTDAGTAYIQTARDRLFVGQGYLNTGAYNSGTSSPLTNTGAGAAINTAGWWWGATNASLYALSRSGIAIVGQSVASVSLLSGDDTIGSAAFGLLDTATGLVWGGYSEAGNTTSVSGGTAIAHEFDIGETQALALYSLYGNSGHGGGYRTLGVHIASGGSLSGVTYTPASCAIDIVTNGSTFDKGIVVVPAALTTQIGGFQNAVNLGNYARINWWRNNSGTDQLQAYIQADNTTAGAVVGHDLLSLSFDSGGVTTLSTENLVLNAPSANSVYLAIGENATGNRSAALYLGASTANSNHDFQILRAAGANGQVTLAQAGTANFAVEVNGANVFLANTGATGIAFPAYGNGVLSVSGGAGQISSVTTLPSGLTVPTPTLTGTATLPDASTLTSSGLGSLVALGVGEAVPSAGNINISGVYEVAGHAVLQVGASTYTQINDATASGSSDILVGNGSDPTIYINSSVIKLRNGAGTSTFATINASGIGLPSGGTVQYTGVTNDVAVFNSSGQIVAANGLATATTPASLSANRRIAVNIGGTTYYIAASTVAW